MVQHLTRKLFIVFSAVAFAVFCVHFFRPGALSQPTKITAPVVRRNNSSPPSNRLKVHHSSSPSNRLKVHNSSPPSNRLIVHYFILHKSFTPDDKTDSITFTDCLSVLSVMKNLVPDDIFVHTNVPEYWPFVNCKPHITNWSNVHIIPSPRRHTMQGRHMTFIQHEADIKVKPITGRKSLI